MAVLVAELERDLTDILVGVGEQKLGQLHLLLQDVLLERDAGDFGEQMGQVFFVIAKIGGDLRYLDMLAAAPFNVVYNIVVELLLLRFLTGLCSFWNT